MRTIATYNAYHLGDNLLHLHFLRKLAQAYPEIGFLHCCRAEHLGQLGEVVIDLDNIRLAEISSEAVMLELGARNGVALHNAWRGAGGWWYGQPDKNDFVAVHLRWFALLAERMGLVSPLTTARDLLFDYPALKARESTDDRIQETGNTTLVINSVPHSGQFQGYSHAAFEGLMQRLVTGGHKVFCTAETNVEGVVSTSSLGASVTAIGRLSQSCRHIIAVATGPLWPTFNIWNAETICTRLLLLDHERIALLPDHTVHTNSLALVPELLRERGLI